MSIDENKEPRIEWSDLVAGMLILFGFLLFLVGLHIITINTTGYAQDVLNTIFIIFVTLFVAFSLFGFVGVLIQILHWLTWCVKTPKWKKKEMRGF
ncbi:MAG: hypothetical protein JRL30_25995 [Deltaproteobacteria bacterium]|nr:hypothetical protein [Deltaproteobacteria bacterium]